MKKLLLAGMALAFFGAPLFSTAKYSTNPDECVGGSFGYLTPFTFTEDDEACAKIGWKPYHVQQGFDLTANTITAGSALAWGNNITPATDDAKKIMNLMAFDITEKQPKRPLTPKKK